MVSFEPPKSTPSGKVILVATAHVKPGKKGITIEALKAGQKRTNSNEEPGTLTFRVTCRIDSEGSFSFWILYILTKIYRCMQEEYASAAAHKEHQASPGFQNFVRILKEQDILDGELSIKYLDDI
ncbi:hypothetical protein BDP27DRAFT_1373410 [Rhodocollybia butyracea]|uniref:ABM domain-containing protein n=1 Tax=Rhodocollybia butyracea TaxID=206335 RepID=A0A9P5TY20_9AGAR|nr:hypothetical protein BDP27DRAFT_1373410 [Rhodocollybia butyracea]